MGKTPSEALLRTGKPPCEEAPVTRIAAVAKYLLFVHKEQDINGILILVPVKHVKQEQEFLSGVRHSFTRALAVLFPLRELNEEKVQVLDSKRSRQ